MRDSSSVLRVTYESVKNGLVMIDFFNAYGSSLVWIFGGAFFFAIGFAFMELLQAARDYYKKNIF